MLKANYVIKGSKEGKEIFNERRSLSLFGALLMKFRIKRWNNSHPSKFIMEPYNGKRCRV